MITIAIYIVAAVVIAWAAIVALSICFAVLGAIIRFLTIPEVLFPLCLGIVCWLAIPLML